MVPYITAAIVITSTIVNVSVYHAIAAETDANPMQPADPTITYVDVDLATVHHCAVSQDLLWFKGGPAHFGDFVVLDLPDMATYWRISDTMHINVTQHVDLLVPDGVMGYWTDVPITIVSGGEIDLYRENRQDMEAGEGQCNCSSCPVLGTRFSRRSYTVGRCARRRPRSGGPYNRSRPTYYEDRYIQELR